MLQNARVTVFIVSELLRENQQGEGVNLSTPNQISVNLIKKIDNSLKNRIKVVTSRNESLAEYAIKNEISLFCSNISMSIKNRTLKLLMKKNWSTYWKV